MQANEPDRRVAGEAPPPSLAPEELISAAHELSRERLAFAIPACLISFGGFTLITVLAGFTNLLNVHVVGPLTLVFVLLLLMFVVVGVLAYCYSRVAARWDSRTEELLGSHGGMS